MEVQCMRMEEGKTLEQYIAYGKHHQFTDLIFPETEVKIHIFNLYTDEMWKTDRKSFRQGR